MKIIRNIVKILLLFLVSIGSGASVCAQEQADSLELAFSTIMANHLINNLPKDNDAYVNYVDGIKASLNDNKSDEYYKGILNGQDILKRFESLQQMGLDLDRDAMIGLLTGMLDSKNSGTIQVDKAKEMINNKIRSILESDTVSVESERKFIENVANESDGVKYPSGIVVITLNDNPEGESISMGDRLSISYEGRLSDGTVFDKTEKPIEMTVGSLIPGFNEGLTIMKTGGTYRLLIPYDLAYGREGIRGVIPGNSALDFTLTIEEKIK